MTCAASESFAVEPGDFTNYLRGATQGLPLGALPPPGLYGGVAADATGAWAARPARATKRPPWRRTRHWLRGKLTVGAQLDLPRGELRRDHRAGEYFGQGASSVNPPFAASSIAGPELANTNFTPIILSWTLGHGWFTAVGLTFVAPIGSRWRSTASDLNLNPHFWTIAPGWAISYLDANWMLSANFWYDINTASRGVIMGAPFLPAGAANGFVSGNELFGDFTAVYKIGKWQLGPVAYFEAQTTTDKPGGGVACTPAICGYQSQIAVGALVGYDFGPVAVQMWFDDTVQCQNAICGLDVGGRMSFKIWGYDAPKPLVAKN
jgi:hypothetical protein